MSCCPVTAEPARDAAAHVGVMKKAGNTNIYVTGPATSKAGVLAFPDIYGLDSGRTKADADTLGKLGYAVVVVDLTDGDYLENTDTLVDWFKKYTFEQQFGPRIQDAINYLKTEAGAERLISYGMCWGSWVGATQTTQPDPVVLGHVSFHPTWIVENILKGDGAVNNLAESVKVPQILMAAGDDPDFVKPEGSVDKILKARADIGAKSEVLLFADMNHGWVHRGDMNDPATKAAVMKAWHAAVKFIQTNCPVNAVVAAAVAAAGLATTLADISHAEKKTEDHHEFVNWSATHECRPKNFHVPETVDEVEKLLKTYHDKKQKLRCMGAGVSPNGLGFSGEISGKKDTNEALLTLALLDKILNVDKDKLQVTVETGYIVGELLDKLRTYGMTMQNVASIRDQQVGGICQAGCHGTGAGIPPIDDQIVEMELVTPAKGKMTLSATKNPELFEMAKCGLGALGVVTKVTLQCVPMHCLIEKTTVMTLEEIRKNHNRWLVEYQHLRYMWIPYTDTVVVVQCRRVQGDEPINEKRFPPIKNSEKVRMEAPRKLYLKLTKGKPAPNYLDWSFTKLRDKLLEINPLDKKHVIRVNEAEKQFWKLSEGYRVAYSDDIIGFDCGGQQLVEEVSFPCAGTLDLDFMEQLLKRIDEEDIPAHSPIEQRWTARSTSAMSPASSSNPHQVFSWVGVILYLPTAEKKAREAIKDRFMEFYATYRDFMEPYGATEHWAKIEWPSDVTERQKMRDRLKKRYPIEKFKKVRDEVDPHHILSNHIVDELCA
ncbi:hypothetical protein JM18_000162 [Phytophthora kernoviae]|uniref:FAD-binding PCMH-type domain-containing protein n=1 Tax=Phytophthora kernoviae TaxID=325452 RepID=A0A8T0MA00_9STRA|nr:hypothetical protein JM16_000191 [Phytophthora kernoviae]KAG2533331.1 hypothetical protein JM18_000162 [Phytophthora kernoviae]